MQQFWLQEVVIITVVIVITFGETMSVIETKLMLLMNWKCWNTQAQRGYFLLIQHLHKIKSGLVEFAKKLDAENLVLRGRQKHERTV